MVKLFSLKSPDEWATTKQACRDIYVVTCFLPSTIRYIRAISKYKPPGGAYISRGDLKKGSLRYEFGGLIFGGAYTWRGLFSEFYGMRF